MAPSAIPLEPAQSGAISPNAPKNVTWTRQGTLPAASLAKEVESCLDSLYQITEKPIGTRRPIRVACLGAGYSGLMMSIVFSQKMKDKNAELVIYERNDDLGGTWLENRYTLSDQMFKRSSTDRRTGILAVNATSQRTIMHTAFLPSLTGPTTMQHRSRFTNTCTKWPISTIAGNISNYDIRYKVLHGTRTVPSGIWRCATVKGMYSMIMSTSLSMLEVF